MCSEEREHYKQPCSESNRLSWQLTRSLETKMRALRRRHSSLLTASSPLTFLSCPQACSGSQISARVLEGTNNTQYHGIWVPAQLCLDVFPTRCPETACVLECCVMITDVSRDFFFFCPEHCNLYCWVRKQKSMKTKEKYHKKCAENSPWLTWGSENFNILSSWLTSSCLREPGLKLVLAKSVNIFAASWLRWSALFIVHKRVE